MPESVVRFPLPLTGGQDFDGGSRQFVTISPRGGHVAFTGSAGVWLRPLDQMDATLVSGSESARNPFFSADGQWLGFWTRDGQLKRVSVSGGAPVSLGAAAYPFGVSWGVDDTILFGQSDGIWQVPGTGGTPTLVIRAEDGEAMYGPQLLPGDDQVLFTLRPAGAASWDESQIVIESLASGERTVLIEGGRDARLLSTGHLVYAIEGTLLAQAFDLDRLVVRGGPVSLVEGVRAGNGTATAAAQFSVSLDGSLVYVTGGGSGAEWGLRWVDHDGREEVIDVPTAAYRYPRLSPDGTRVAAEIQGPDTGAAIWVADTTRGTLSRVISEVARAPIWTPDGRQLVFTSVQDGGFGFYRNSADGTGDVEHLVTIEGGVGLRAGNWSPDGSRLVFRLNQGPTRGDIAVLSMEGERSWEPLIATEARECCPVLSPDGQWVAYPSAETGRPEVYVQRFPDLGERQQISTDGGLDPVWSPDGRALYYLGTGGNAPDDMRVVSIDSGPPLSVGNPEVLFVRDMGPIRPAGSERQYDISPDGQRFLMLSTLDASEAGVVSPQINVVLNWFEELKARVPIN